MHSVNVQCVSGSEAQVILVMQQIRIKQPKPFQIGLVLVIATRPPSVMMPASILMHAKLGNLELSEVHASTCTIVYISIQRISAKESISSKSE